MMINDGIWVLRIRSPQEYTHRLWQPYTDFRLAMEYACEHFAIAYTTMWKWNGQAFIYSDAYLKPWDIKADLVIEWRKLNR